MNLNMKIYSISKNNSVLLFFDAHWINRRVPELVGSKIIDGLIDKKYSIFLIKPPNSDYTFYENRYKRNINICEGSISEIENILTKMDLCISTDSAWLHMAYYKEIPTVGLFGSLNGEQWAPPGTKVVYSEKPLKSEERYKLKNETKTPLEYLDVDKILETLDR